MGSPRASTAVLLYAASAILLVAGCSSSVERAVSDPPTPSAERCRQPGTTSGHVVVGSPVSTPGLVVVPPGSVPPPSPQLPTVASVAIDPVAADTDEVHYAFAGNGTVAWSVRFVESPTLRGSDAAVPITGSCILQIDLSGVASDDVPPTARPVRLASPRATSVVEVLRYGSATEISQSFVGVRSGTATVSVDDVAARLTVRVSG